VITADPRFIRAVDFFNAGDYLEASDEFEELFFEAVRDEVDFVRTLMQFSVGLHHVQTGQRRPAIERIEEGLKVVASSDFGVDLAELRDGMRAALDVFKRGGRPSWPQIRITPHHTEV
jgi:predicted metal-dependent hydrolase